VTSKPGERPVVRLAADANVLLSAAMGRAAFKVMQPSFPVSVTLACVASVVDEVREYLPSVAEEQGLDSNKVLALFEAFEIEEHPVGIYQAKLEEARRQIWKRDPDDVELLALALSLGIPVWTNDKDFEDTKVERYTTAQLLAKYGVFGK
jgi:predicted nucleic acid-binding protein